MYTVEELIGNLLLRHNCVIIPSFGGFVAKQTSATIDYKNGVMLPPRKSVLFNRQLINNDGLLVAEYAFENKVQYPQAESNILANVAEWNEILRNGERITLDRVGYLFYDQEKNLCFEQDRFFNLLLESYGLGKVHFVTEDDIQLTKHITAVAAQKVEEEKEIFEPVFNLVSLPSIEDEVVVSQEEFVLVDHPQIKSHSKVWKYVAAAVLLPIGFYSFWLPMKTDVLESGLISFKDFNPAYKAAKGMYTKISSSDLKLQKHTEDLSLEKAVKTLPSDVHIYSYEFDKNLYIPVRVSEGKEQNFVEEKEQTASIEKEPIKIEVLKEKTLTKTTVVKLDQPISSTSKNFDFIIGSFSTEERANDLIASMKSKGLKAYLIKDNSGSNRVSAGSAGTVSEINEIAEKSKTNGFQGWILKK